MRNKTVDISARMQALTAMVTPGNIVCDIGCDHGFVSIYLVQKGIANKVFAMDVRSGPLSHAQAHILEYGLENRIETRLSDGLESLKPGEAECMICAGMGGPLMMKILREGSDKAHLMSELILQPQSEIAQFRKFLRTSGYVIVKEDMVLEEGKYYPVIKAVPGSEQKNNDLLKQQIYDLYGAYLLEHKHPVLKQYLEYSRNITEELQVRLEEQKSEKALEKLPEVREKLELISTALKFFV